MIGCKLSPLDTAVFGLPVFRSYADTAEQIAADLDVTKRSRGKLLILRLSTDHCSLVQKLLGDGFLLTDVLGHFQIRITEALSHEADECGALPYRFAREGEEELLVDMARRSFRGKPSHYRADPRLRAADCDEIYAEAMRNYFRARGRLSEVIVVESDGKPVGTTVLEMFAPPVGNGAFAAVDTAQRGGDGLKIYRSLVLRGIELGFQRGFSRARVASSNRNLIVHKVLARIGYEPTAYEYTLHYWLDN